MSDLGIHFLGALLVMWTVGIAGMLVAWFIGRKWAKEARKA